VTARDAVLFRDGSRMFRCARGDSDRVETGLAIGDEMAVAHDEAGTEAADAKVLAARHPRQIVDRRLHERNLYQPPAQARESLYDLLGSSTRSSRGRGKLTCSSRIVRDSTRAPKRVCSACTHSDTISSGALAPAVISTVSSPVKQSFGKSRMPSTR